MSSSRVAVAMAAILVAVTMSGNAVQRSRKFDVPKETSIFEHGIYDVVSLNGEWEMAYRPHAHEAVECPSFTGVRIAGAVPGYWEDMVEAFRAAGMDDAFRVNPLFERQRLPIAGSASDVTLPNIYGCFYYRRTVELDKAGDAVLAFEGDASGAYRMVRATKNRFGAAHDREERIVRIGARERRAASRHSGLA